jgi:hypothetical protein
MARPGKRPSKSLEWHAQNNGLGPKMGHQSWLSAYNDGYSNADVIRWVDGDPENRNHLIYITRQNSYKASLIKTHYKEQQI